MKNPFKFGTIVEGDYFTDRTAELAIVKQTMNSENHLILISPRRFGKSSLIRKVVQEIGRPYILLNLQKVISTTDFAANILKEVFRRYPKEKWKHYISHFRFVPTISVNPITDGFDLSFQPSVDGNVVLEDALQVLENISTPVHKLIVIFDEFQEIIGLDKGIDKRLRTILQEQQNINYIFLGSQESMMTEIFERKKSPFYHFGKLMALSKIPYTDFFTYIGERLLSVAGEQTQEIATQVLQLTNCHPYYTQQLCSQIWDMLSLQESAGDVVNQAVKQLIQIHDLDYERLWFTFNKTDKRIIQSLCKGQNPMENYAYPPSTTYSSIKKLMKSGYISHADKYELEDPFFMRWIQNKQL